MVVVNTLTSHDGEGGNRNDTLKMLRKFPLIARGWSMALRKPSNCFCKGNRWYGVAKDSQIPHCVLRKRLYCKRAMVVCVAVCTSGAQTCPLHNAMAVCVVVQSAVSMPDVVISKASRLLARCQPTVAVPNQFRFWGALIPSSVDAQNCNGRRSSYS